MNQGEFHRAGCLVVFWIEFALSGRQEVRDAHHSRDIPLNPLSTKRAAQVTLLDLTS